MPAMSSMDFVFALTMIVPSGIADQTRRMPGLVCTRARMSAGTVVCPFELIQEAMSQEASKSTDTAVTSRWGAMYEHAANILHLRQGIEDPDKIDANVRNGVRVGGVNLWVLMFAILVASVGLNVNSTAVIIGAMLISPLMSPIVGIGYGLGILDFPLVRLALRNLLIFTVISLLTSTLYFTLSPLDEPGSELLARTAPSLWDVLIAFFGGSAGAIAMTRRDVPNVVPGVAIATALMPPMCTAGFALAHLRWDWFGGALYLYTINSVFIAFATLLLVKLMKLRAPSSQVSAEALLGARWLTTITVLAVAAPSVFLAHRLVQAESFAALARTAVASSARDASFVVIDSQIEGESRRVTLTVAGEAPPANLSHQIEQVLGEAGFKDSEVLVRSASARQLDVGILKKEIHSSLVQRFAEENEAIRAQVVQLRNKNEASTAAEATLRALPSEIQAQYPQISSVTVGLALADAVATAPVSRVVMVQIKQTRQLNKVERDRLTTWLRVRLSGSDLRLSYE